MKVEVKHPWPESYLWSRKTSAKISKATEQAEQKTEVISVELWIGSDFYRMSWSVLKIRCSFLLFPFLLSNNERWFSCFGCISRSLFGLWPRSTFPYLLLNYIMAKITSGSKENFSIYIQISKFAFMGWNSFGLEYCVSYPTWIGPQGHILTTFGSICVNK